MPSATGTLQAPASLSFDYSAGNITVHKTFTFDATYIDPRGHGGAARWRADPRAGGLARRASATRRTLQAYAGAQIDTSQNGKDEHEAFKKVSSGNTLNGPFDWAGVSDQYFAAIFLPDAPQTATVATLHNQIDVNKVQRGARGVRHGCTGQGHGAGAGAGRGAGRHVRAYADAASSSGPRLSTCSRP